MSSAHAVDFTYNDTTTGSIPDADTACATPLVRTINVTNSFTIGDVNLGVVIDHTFRGDLVVSLSSPAGTLVNMLVNEGGSAADFNVLLNDQAATFIGTTNHDATAPYPQFERQGSSNLAVFNGEAANGIWTLSMCDTAAGDLGTFNRFQLDFLQGSTSVFSQPSDTAATGTIINDYAAVTGLSGTTVTVDSSAGFSAGDTGLLIQMKGSTVNRSDDASHGDISTYGSAGRFEFVDIASVAAGSVTLSSAPTIAFQTSGVVQLIRVASYTNQTLTGITSAPPWNGTKGGVVVIDDSGTLTLSGTIDVTGLGFQGGALATEIPFDGCASDQLNYTGPAADGNGNKGEGIVVDNSLHRALRGHNANGGGGGNITDAGGGGGANYGAGGLGGRELDLCDNDGHFGGLGGQALDYSPMNRVFMGGGGGSGSEISQTAVGGARGGGGIVIIRADQFVSSSGRILTNGLTANNDDVNGADGGGAAGSVAISVNNGISGSPTIEAQGGNGGSDFNTSFAHGTGGGGGGGAILLNGAQCADVNWTAKEGLAGTSTRGDTFNDANWGAVDGEPGNCLGNFTAVPKIADTIDYGDAPISGTAPDGSSTNNYGEASHTIVSGLSLGAGDPDEDTANQPTANADGDDVDGTDDEDGISAFPTLTEGETSYSLPIANITTNGTGTLHGWIDFDGNGTFDSDEHHSVVVTNGTPASALNWSFTDLMSAGTTFARFRFTSDASVTNVTPSSAAADGEVEDYTLIIAAASGCPLGSGTADASIAAYISAEVKGTNAVARSATDTLDDTWRTAAGLPTVGTVVPWFGYTATDPIANSATALFSTNGVSVDVAFVNVEPVNSCVGTLNTNGAPALTQATNLQASAPRPASLYNSSNQPAYWNETPTDGNSGSPNAVRFTFATPVSSFGAWFGDMETRTDGNAAPAYLRLLDSSGDRIGQDIAIAPTNIIDGGVSSVVDQSQCGSSATNIGCGNSSTRWVGFVDNAGAARVKQVLVIVGDDDAGDNAALEHLSFIGADIVPYDYGDAPTSGTAPDGSSSNAYGEAGHTIVNGIYLGTGEPDIDATHQPTTAANGDDNDGTDDEDGITLPSLTQGQTATISAKVAGVGGYLQAWIDFDGNGTFDAGEQIATDLQDGGAGDTSATTGTISFDVAVPLSAITSQTYVRFRWSTTAGLDTTTVASDGEVEDYVTTIAIGGFAVKGRVYQDTNVDGINNDTNGVSGLPIVLLDVNNNTCVSTKTDAQGYYVFPSVLVGDYQLYEASHESVPTPSNCGIANAKDPKGYQSTTNNVLAQFSVVDADITDKDFGDVQEPLFTPDNTGSILPNNVVFYNHQFKASSTGSVNFTKANTGNIVTGWSSVIYQDSNCNNTLDNAEGNAPIVANLPTVEGQTICLINKVYAPATITDGETYNNFIRADFNFNNNVFAGITTLTVVDVTKAAAINVSVGTSRLELVKTVENITQGTVETEIQNQAKPGDILKYRIYYRNTGTGILTNPVIYDQIPNFTTLNGIPICEIPLPASLTNCMSSVNGSSIEWRFPVIDALQGGASGVVSYEVVVD